MNENPTRIREVVAVFLVLATAVLGVMSLQQRPGSFRPAGDPSTLSAPVGAQEVTARLWEDPFAAAHAAHAQKETRVSDSAHSLEALRNSVQQRWGEYDGRVRVLAVFAEAAPFPEDKEVRLRLRFAVVRALLAEGWRPHDRTHIGYIDLGGTNGVPEAQRTDRAAGVQPSPALAPFEWFKNEGTNRWAMLVLWLPEEAFADQPVGRLREAASRLLPTRWNEHAERTLPFDLIGPRSSDTLRRMATENSSQPDKAVAPLGLRLGLTVYSPHATAPDAALLDAASDTTGPARKALSAKVVANLTAAFGPNSQVRFVNLQQTDEVLAWLLVEELELRGLSLRADTTNAQGRARVVLISEGDTFYGRALPDAFLAAACAGSDRLVDVRAKLPEVIRSDATKVPFVAPPNILRVTYLRGLDGRTARDTKTDSGEATSSAEDRLRAMFTASGPVAEGESQFDYIQRLGERLQAMDDQLRAAANPFKPAGITAIGVLGSDLYDKLTLMQGLRRCFPGVLFFTTDLDARLWDSKLGDATRNLIVASAYGLTPPGAVPGSLAPVFRDSYQTATWVAVRAALAETGAEVFRPLPLMAEIGRHGPVYLRLGTNTVEALRGETGIADDADVGTHRFPIQGWPKWIGLLAVIAVLVGLLIRRTHRGPFGSSTVTDSAKEEASESAREEARCASCQNRFRVVSLLGSAGLVAGAYVGFWWLGERPGGEPMALTEGVSLWPTELVRLGLLCLIGGLAVRGFPLDYCRRRARLWREYFAPQPYADLPRRNSVDAALDLGGGAEPGNESPHAQRVLAENAYREMLIHSDLRRRVGRVAGYTVVYLVFGVGLFLLLGIPSRPFRGETAKWLDLTLLMASVVGFVWLTCYAVDGACLARRLLCSLARYPTRWPDHVVARTADALGFPALAKDDKAEHPLNSALEGLIDVKVAAEVTKEMGTNFYLPFIVMMFMLISRSAIFDNWPWPPALVIINLCSFVLVISVAVMVRQAARKIRTSALQFLDRHIFQAKADAVPKAQPSDSDRPSGLWQMLEEVTRWLCHAMTLGKQWMALGTPARDPVTAPPSPPGRITPSLKQLETIREQILAEREGAYSRTIQDPAFLAMLIPTGGYGLFVVLVQMLFGG